MWSARPAPECGTARLRRASAAALVLVLACASARAEPYLAVQTGLRCAQCHVNQTGGGMRTPFGNQFAQTQLASNRLPGAAGGWLGRIGGLWGVGANVRAAAIRTEVAGSSQTSDFDLREARVYLSFTPIADRLSFYLDQYVAPGASQNREAFVRYSAADGSHYLKAGRLYLPFGWRLQDNSAFVRAQSAIDMSGPDLGVELGWDGGPLSLQFAISNGTFGESEVDSGKQYSLQLVYGQDAWRVGVAGNYNDQAVGDRAAWGLFGGLRTGPIAWLAEVDLIEDRSSAATPAGKLRSFAWLLEANWRPVQGHNLKFSAEGLDPDRGGDADPQARFSAVYEYTPIAFLQLRGGARRYDGPSQFPLQNRRQVFIELHGFF
jgi:hypothetical protein